jgi:hypothetical protein
VLSPVTLPTGCERVEGLLGGRSRTTSRPLGLPGGYGFNADSLLVNDRVVVEPSLPAVSTAVAASE